MRWAVALAWALSVGLVLPYSPYIKYIDLSVSRRPSNRSMYRGGIISDVKGSGWFILKFALPPFSPPFPSVVELSKQNTHSEIILTLYCATAL